MKHVSVHYHLGKSQQFTLKHGHFAIVAMTSRDSVVTLWIIYPGAIGNHNKIGSTPSWLVVWTPLKNISQLGWLFPIYGKIKNVPNHQPARYCQLVHRAGIPSGGCQLGIISGGFSSWKIHFRKHPKVVSHEENRNHPTTQRCLNRFLWRCIYCKQNLSSAIFICVSSIDLHYSSYIGGISSFEKPWCSRSLKTYTYIVHI